MTGSDRPHPVQWPAVLQYRDDNELSLFRDAGQWAEMMAEHRGGFTPDDRLIDSAGRVFRPSLDHAGAVLLTAGEGRIALDEFTTLLRAHAVTAGSCCAGKVGCNAVDEGIALIASLEEGV